MPLDPPQTSNSDTTWIINGRYNSTTITGFQVAITVESSATESEGDALLQELVNLLAPKYYNVTGTKGYTAYTTRNMTPS